MNLIIKQIIVVIITFLIILWFQNSDDKKHKRNRESLYDKYKLPLLVSTIIGLILNLSLLFNINECKLNNIIKEVNIITPIKEVQIHPCNYDNIKEIINNLQISTDLPDF